jgi:Spy/CpxP family protein refolding chaperone
MRARLVVLVGMVAMLAACDQSNPASPASATSEVVDLVPDYAVSPAASIDAAGIGSSELPEPLRLTVEQKATILALHEAFMSANASDVAALRAIESQAKAAMRAGKSRDEVRAILAQGEPVRARLEVAFRKLQADIWAVYTAEQRAWIEGHRPRNCAPGAARLTETQIKQIRALEEQFYASVKPDLELIRTIAAEAKQAREAGKSREEVAAILARAAEPHRRVAEAERKLQTSILALLSVEQRRAWACRRG